MHGLSLLPEGRCSVIVPSAIRKPASTMSFESDSKQLRGNIGASHDSPQSQANALMTQAILVVTACYARQIEPILRNA